MPVIKTAYDLREQLQHKRILIELSKHVGIPFRGSEESGEVGSWKRSLPVLANTLCAARLGHVQVLLEYKLPYSPKRVDAILCGVHPETGKPSYVLVELKQWEKAKATGAGLVLTPYGKKQPDLHPAEQVRRYCRQLLDFVPAFARIPGQVKGIAYMHNAVRGADWSLDEFEFDDFGQLYTSDLQADLVADLWSLLDTDPATAGAAMAAAHELISAPPSPARNLLKTAADAFDDRDDFVLLDEQQVAYKTVLDAVAEADSGGGKKKVVVVNGGPGSGKSAIAVTLLAALARQKRKALHATGSKAFTETLRLKVSGGDVRSGEIFKYFNEFRRAPADALDVLICDEAHRVRGMPRHLHGRVRSQIDELIDVAKVPLFLLDEHQVVRPTEIGTKTDIVSIAEMKGCQVIEISLDGQYRCGGSAKFDEWVVRLLGLGAEPPVTWSELVDDTEDEYVVDSVGSPHELESWLLRQAKHFSGTARMAAGFCWEWRDPVEVEGSLRLLEDVQIGGWRRPWNAKQGFDVPGVPSASLWASDPDGFGQVGCIYTAQGFEYDWAGAIFGDDLVIRDGEWRARRDFSFDKSVKAADPADFDRLVRNTYKVLMTRGMQGLCVYSTDDETNAFLRRYAR
ncbi:DNA/RNA helicase domain-containing protein [Amycolatopsis japonica]